MNTTITKLDKQYKIKFQFKVNTHSSTWANILDFGDPPSGRDPAFWISPTKMLYQAFNINGAATDNTVPVTIVEGQFYTVEMTQFLVVNKVITHFEHAHGKIDIIILIIKSYSMYCK